MNSDICIIEIRGGTGGNEAKIWASDLLRMYRKFALSKSWKFLTLNEGALRIKGPQAYSLLSNETGVHRVQRIPLTERRGRIHTSTATVVVLPEIPESETIVKESDLSWQFYRSGGHGGQNVNKVATAVRLTHIPTNIIVTCQTERDQFQNRQQALSLLRSKLWERMEAQKEREIAGYRSKIGRGMRAEKIRTYNFPQNRVTNHVTGKSYYNLDKIIEGDLSKLFR
jgi:peptide chain release factor 1